MRLTSEAYHAPGGTLLQTIGYSYDDAGNRTGRTVTPGGGTASAYSYAIIHRSVGLVRFRLSLGEKLDARDDSGDTPLRGAASVGDLAIVQALVEGGANPLIQDWDSGMDSIDIATKRGHNAVAAYLRQQVVSRRLERPAEDE